MGFLKFLWKFRYTSKTLLQPNKSFKIALWSEKIGTIVNAHTKVKPGGCTQISITNYKF